MKYKNNNKNNELIALVKTLVDKKVITEQEIKNKKQQLLNLKNDNKIK